MEGCATSNTLIGYNRVRADVSPGLTRGSTSSRDLHVRAIRPAWPIGAVKRNMSILQWAALVLGTCLAVCFWLLYRGLLQHGRGLMRIQDLESRLAGVSSVEESPPSQQRLFRSFQVNDQYDANNILRDVLFRDEYRIAQKRLGPGDVIVDVGANIGAFSYLCHALGSRAIFCYEPGARNFELLKCNVGCLPGVHVFRAAVWRSDSDGQREVMLSEGPQSGSHSVLSAGHVVDFAAQRLVDSSAPGYPAACVSLDAILERFSRVKLLKLDCEGSEFPILLTSRRLDCVERIVGEVHEQEEEVAAVLDPSSRVPGHAAYRLVDLVAKLESAGFGVTTRDGGAGHLYLFDARRKFQA
jgi:FkbM family methyltransferase